jgi:hypothetical protein
VLHFLVTGILRSRLGVALVLAALVLGVVGVARTLSGPEGNDSTARPPARPLVTVTPTVANDGLLAPGATPSPVRSPGAAAPEAVALAFASDWVAHTGVSMAAWHDRLAARSTARLAAELSGVDPAGVPAGRLTGEPAVIPHAATLVEVVIPVDSGSLRLRLVAPEGRWLVDGVDWERA